MADTPETTIQLFYDMFAEGKVKELLEACCTENVHWISPGDVKRLPWAACDVHGRDAVLNFIYRMGGAAKFEDAKRPKPWIVQDPCGTGHEGTHVAVLSTCTVIYNQTGKSCHHSACHVFRMIQKDGKWVICWVKEFSDSAALERLMEE
jgi:ketosteroid isomerase-like protein